MITHHLSDEYLVEYAAGSLPHAESLVVASHLALCGVCRARVEAFETVGAVMLEDGDAEDVSTGAFDAVMAMIATPGADERARRIEFDEATLRTIPAPLREHLDASLADLEWKRVSRGVDEVRLHDEQGIRISLLRAQAGTKLPSHTHAGEEFTLVLDGGYSDSDGDYRRGDVTLADSTTDHSPIADDDGPCVCLLVRNGAARLTGPVARFFNPFIRG